MNAVDAGRADVVKVLLMVDNGTGGGGARVDVRNNDVRNTSCADIQL